MDLRSIELFRDFRDEEIEKFIPAIEQLDLKKGEILFSEGEPGDALFIIHSGAVRIFKTIDASTGEEKSLALLNAGTYLGEMTLMDGTPRSASARAEENSTVLKISRRNFIQLLSGYPQGAIRIFVSFMKVISERLRRTNEELVALYEIGKIVSAAPPLNQMLGQMTLALANTAKVELCAFFILNEITGRLEIRQAVGEGSVNLLNMKFNASESIVGRALASQQTLCANDFDNSDNYKNIKRVGYERNSMLVAPLVRKGRPFGAILLAQRSDGLPFDNANINLINGVASQAAAAIESALHAQETAAKEQYDRKYFQF